MRTKLIILLCLCAALAHGQNWSNHLGQTMYFGQNMQLITSASGGGGGGNNVVINTGQNCGSFTNSSVNWIITPPASVTNGDTVILAASLINGNPWNTTHLSKTTGTSSIGTISVVSSNSVGSAIPGTAIFMIPITGTGTLTLDYNDSSGGYYAFGLTEISGLAASPTLAHGTFNGSTTNATTGSLTTTTNGVVLYVAGHNPNDTWTAGYSDQLIYDHLVGATDMTIYFSYKLVSASPNTMTSWNPITDEPWQVTYLYLASQ